MQHQEEANLHFPPVNSMDIAPFIVPDSAWNGNNRDECADHSQINQRIWDTETEKNRSFSGVFMDFPLTLLMGRWKNGKIFSLEWGRAESQIQNFFGSSQPAAPQGTQGLQMLGKQEIK